MNIDGHTVRIDSIDAVTEIDARVGGMDEGTDKMARGKFDVFVRGQRITIVRNKRCSSDKAEGAAALKSVVASLTEIRDPIVACIP